MVSVLFEEEDRSSRSSANSSVASSSKEPSTTSGGTATSKQSGPLLREHDNQAVKGSRILMLLVFLLVATAASIAVFKVIQAQERNEYQAKFDQYASQVIAVYRVNSRNMNDVYSIWSSAISAAAFGQEWPFVTLPAFEGQAQQVMDQTGARSMGLSRIVQEDQREAWNNWTVQNQDWFYDAYHETQDKEHAEESVEAPPPPLASYIWNQSPIMPATETHVNYSYYLPLWQASPVETTSFQNFDTFGWPDFPFDDFDNMVSTQNPFNSFTSNLDAYEPGSNSTWGENWPESFLMLPIFDKVTSGKNRTMVASLSSILPWHHYFLDLFPPNTTESLTLVISNNCDQVFSYEIEGSNITYLGVGNRRETNDVEPQTTDFFPFSSESRCKHTLHLYPSLAFSNSYSNQGKPVRYTLSVIGMFLLMALVFLVYDVSVERRQSKVVSTAERSTAIVTSLFPKQIATQLMEERKRDSKNRNSSSRRSGYTAATNRMEVSDRSTWLQPWQSPGAAVTTSFRGVERPLSSSTRSSKPIAELFPSATVLFADIVGFTAWSSEREPEQVFELLEQIYASFDRVAKSRKVFKVETIGDCYMAASGIPEKRKDHTLIMARFASDCVRKMQHVVRRLEVTLGPETGDLGIRIGIHAGPVTAGVLRGDKARFQLFGDTVNTAARMESTGVKNKIQISAEAAHAIDQASYDDVWAVLREDKIEAKGKGLLQTYWLESSTLSSSRSGDSAWHNSGRSSDTMYTSSEDDGNHSAREHLRESVLVDDTAHTKLNRTIEWSVDVLQKLLKQVVAMRGGTTETSRLSKGIDANFRKGQSPLDEVVDIITLPSKQRKYKLELDEVELSPQVIFQLRGFVKSVASMYQSNAFHSFDHAAHVTQSVMKLLSRVVTPASDMITSSSGSVIQDEEDLHKYTYGITSDPLTQFAVAFAALIHDIDHPGVPNTTLVQEKSVLAVAYGNKSVAEQNSVDLAWNLLWEPCYKELRACIFLNDHEYHRFRQLVINAVMATDVVDKDLGAARKQRWADAFSGSGNRGATNQDDVDMDSNRKATIVIEHLIQASDVAHTMQHWHVYLRWNERFFVECYQGYIDGRTTVDPSIGWYKGELAFFDFYIIPLAKKLKECDVFGVASDEYLQYAEANRMEWETKGRNVVAGYLLKV